MALRALMLAKSIKEKREALTALEAVDFETREAEIAQSIEDAQTDEERSAVEAAITEFENEKNETAQKIATIRGELDALEAELAGIEAAAPAETGDELKPVDTRKDEKKMKIRESKEYIDAYVDYVKSGDMTRAKKLIADATADEERALLTDAVTGGQLPVPTYLEGRIRQAWENDEIMSRVTRTYLGGNVKVAFELSASDAVVHTEGAAAPAEETLTLGVVTIAPQSIKKWISISDEAMDIGGEAFLDYIYDELTYKIVQKAASITVGLIAAAPAASTATAAGQPQITAAPAVGTVAEALGNLAAEARPIAIMNRLTWSAFKAAQYANQFNVDPFEGLTVAFTSALPAYSAAASGAVYMIVGDLRGVQANFPNGDNVRIKYNDISRAKEDLVEVVGRQFVGIGVVNPKYFVNVKKPASV